MSQKIGSGSGRIAKLIGEHKSNDSIVNELYLASLGRPPKLKERQMVLGVLAFTPVNERKSVLEDVLLTLLNSKEFLLIH
jgi:hypothetical protein